MNAVEFAIHHFFILSHFKNIFMRIRKLLDIFLRVFISYEESG